MPARDTANHGSLLGLEAARCGLTQPTITLRRRTVRGGQRLVRHVVVRGADPAAREHGAAVADQAAQAQRRRGDVLCVVAYDLDAHQVHAAAAAQVWDQPRSTALPESMQTGPEQLSLAHSTVLFG